jgi:hypothetical protein
VFRVEELKKIGATQVVVCLKLSVQLSSAREAMKIGPERGKLKNLHYKHPLTGNG